LHFIERDDHKTTKIRVSLPRDKVDKNQTILINCIQYKKYYSYTENLTEFYGLGDLEV